MSKRLEEQNRKFRESFRAVIKYAQQNVGSLDKQQQTLLLYAATPEMELPIRNRPSVSCHALKKAEVEALEKMGIDTSTRNSTRFYGDGF